ncbi:hypothetical protein [Nocardioides daejeonensis]|uniref:hypothetical protein n=1 Tax=Nocardioides daejeonensis TaxID=1046556 RepID=UPI000D74C8BF|nr:hypothetical protein [Nocardioides daejeonensis]
MPYTPLAVARRLSVALAAAVLTLLSACSGSTGEDALHLDTDGDTQTYRQGEDELVVGTGLPDGFPAQIPVIDGALSGGSRVVTGQGTAWTVAVTTDKALAAAVDEVRAGLTGAGLDEVLASTGPEGGVLGYEGTDHLVQVAITPADVGTALTYTVAEKAI